MEAFGSYHPDWGIYTEEFIPGENVEQQLSRLAQKGETRRLMNQWPFVAWNALAAHVGFWDWDVTAGQLNWSPEFYRLFGLDPNEGASFDAWRRALHPDDREGAEAKIERAIAKRTPTAPKPIRESAVTAGLTRESR